MDAIALILIAIFLEYGGHHWGEAFVMDGQETDVDQEIQTLQQKLASLQTQLSTLNQKLDNVTLAKKQAVAFTALLTSTITTMGDHQQIVFDNVLTNEGNGYSSRHGFFSAPVSGVYAFYLTVTNIPGVSASLVLMKNGQILAPVLAHGTDQNGWQTSTIATMVKLNAGDDVWAQNEGHFSNVEKLDGSGWSSFSGHLVAPY
ncbi:hypothetical protein CHS0354_012490 [Potamilus streckersoni]|uniref:C1q domain-containing protein n=1 Tax=Potamilus streckersoni TaxID=2493646 RepID=A0AAE0S0I9_9BIVA|nr:hypothetical protein CHS0354_012490 [Potamilus streckersoni]